MGKPDPPPASPGGEVRIFPIGAQAGAKSIETRRRTT